MNSQVITSSANVTQGDRFSLTIFFALAVHAILILGVSFDLIDNSADTLSTMEITLVNNRSEEEPEKADYLAQANQLGGGNQQDKIRPSSPFSNPLPTPDKGFAPQSRDDMSPPKLQETEQQQQVMTVDNSPQQVDTAKESPSPISTTSITASQLFERSQEIARLSAEINRLKQAYQQTPKHTYVHGANAKAYRFASYMDAWRAKVERIGNMNYPEAAVKNNLTGTLLLDVAINPDGSVHSTRVLRSSGYPVLDKAAIRIVNLAAPYPPLTKDILQDTDILHIPRVWRFRSDSRLQTISQ